MSRFLDPVRLGGGVKPDRTNLVFNPSFESSTSTSTYWGATNATIAQTSTVAYSGVNCLQVTCTSANAETNANTTPPAGWMPVTVGTTYAASAYVRAATVSRSCVMRIKWTDGSGTLVADKWSTPASDSTSAWVRLSVSDVAPTGATYAQIYVYYGYDTHSYVIAAGEVHYLDAVLLEAADSIQPYFDGDTPGCRWSGAPHASTAQTAVNLGGAALAGLAGLAPARVNLIPNPNFEVDATGWAPGASSTVTRSTVWAAVGTATGVSTCTSSNYTSCWSSVMAATAGATYTASATVRMAASNASSGPVYIKLVWIDSGGNQFVTSSSPAVTVTTTPQRLSVTANAPAGTVGVQVTIIMQPCALNDAFYFDAVMAEQSPTLGTYFDGSTAGYRWYGPANISASGQAVDLGGYALTNVAALSYVDTRPVVIATSTVATSVPSGGNPVRLVINTATEDPGGWVDTVNNQIIIKTAGVYRFTAGVGFTPAAGAMRLLRLYVNGGNASMDSVMWPSTNDPARTSVTYVKRVPAGATYYAGVYQTTGSTLTTETVMTYLCAEYLRP